MLEVPLASLAALKSTKWRDTVQMELIKKCLVGTLWNLAGTTEKSEKKNTKHYSYVHFYFIFLFVLRVWLHICRLLILSSVSSYFSEGEFRA